jgi:hypothetical protein
MATNNFLPFAPTDTGTNLLTQAEYIAAADRTIGNQPGVASSKLVNKATRQATFVVSQIAQYISNKLNANVLDDADTAALLAQIVSAFAPNDGYAVENLTLAATVGSSALTIAVKSQAAANCSATDPAFISFRSATLTSGVYNRRSVTAALSLVISSGSTLGQTSAQPSCIYVYAIDNAGTVELAASHALYSEGSLVSTTAEGGAGAADSPVTMYSTTARSNVPCRLIGVLTNTQATAGTWATVPSQIQLMPSATFKPATQQVLAGAGTYYVPAGCTRIRLRLIGGGGGGGGSGTGASTGMTNGGDTTINTTLLVAKGGSAGFTNGYGGLGGIAGTVGAGCVGFTRAGTAGGSNTSNTTGISGSGGMGGSSVLGGGGYNGGSSNPSSGGTAQAATGSGGGGGGGGVTNATFGGSGGGAGGYTEAWIDCLSAAWASSFAYSVGAAGSGGASGGGAAGTIGGNGAAGTIIIDEFYD